MSSEDEVPTPAPAAPVSMAWGTSPSLYLSYGWVSMKGRRPALTDAVAAEQSFTALSPPMGLDYFAVFDGHFGAAVAEHLRARLGTAIAERVESELLTETPRFGASHDVPGWWRTVLQEAFQAVDEEMASVGEAGEAAAVGATALVALVLDKYIVLANCGVSRAVLSRGSEVMQLTSEHRVKLPLALGIHMSCPKPDACHLSQQVQLNRPDEKPLQGVENDGGRVDESTSKVDNVLKTTRAFGSSLYKPCVTSEPEVTVVEREPQDEFLILASDGLWDAVAPASACDFVRQRLLKPSVITMPWETLLDDRGSPTVLAKELAEGAVRAGSQDNVSVALVLFMDFWSQRANK
ncbi:probable protein phosphatase 2C 8 [Phragmites australis]|uniref:probable protein phosphatase 2C 8 n=1 Tax=Phragmites australis TaxID=29695 RepID=UPI002D769C6A|nr:probable protein phosphatase 2C 8 [Phragmites australis]